MNMAAIGFCCIDVYENIGKRYATGNGVDCIVHLARRGVSTAVVSVVGTDGVKCLIYAGNIRWIHPISR